MLANELRIGNLVYYNGNHNETGIVSSSQPKYFIQCCSVIEYSKDLKIGLNNRFDIVYDLEEIKPIPLTEELLLKFGFEKLESDIKSFGKIFNNNQDIFIVSIDSDGNFYVSLDRKIILKYVHKLQNLFFELTDEKL